ncbi:MAG TPA: CotH kinase family protein, partial [Bacteroidales bacterium]
MILCLGSIHAENNSTFPQLTNIPTVYIQTKNRQDITSKDIYLKGIVTIVSENGSSIFTDSIQIKGRGNASWSFPKKPYRMKLYNKANLLGMPAKAKDWTLINNYGDKTLMRNLLAFD